MRPPILLAALASTLLAAAACTPPEGPDPTTPASYQTASNGAAHDDGDHDHDHDGHDDGDGDHDGHEHHHHAPPRATSAEAARVRIMQTQDLACGSTVALGPVDVHEPMHSEEEALDMLRRRAADLGADAVLGVEFHHGEGGQAPTHLSGLAVRCGDLLQGRTYDVLGKIEVPGDMGDEDDAFQALKAKAAAMGADLILDIGFQHGDGTAGSKTTMSGTAVKTH